MMIMIIVLLLLMIIIMIILIVLLVMIIGVTIIREFKDVVFEDVVLDNNSFVTLLYIVL